MTTRSYPHRKRTPLEKGKLIGAKPAPLLARHVWPHLDEASNRKASLRLQCSISPLIAICGGAANGRRDIREVEAFPERISRRPRIRRPCANSPARDLAVQSSQILLAGIGGAQLWVRSKLPWRGPPPPQIAMPLYSGAPHPGSACDVQSLRLTDDISRGAGQSRPARRLPQSWGSTHTKSPPCRFLGTPGPSREASRSHTPTCGGAYRVHLDRLLDAALPGESNQQAVFQAYPA